MAVAAPPSAPVDTAGPHVAAFFREYLRHFKGRFAGTPFELEPWQAELMDEAFALDENGVRIYEDVLVGISKKNGKSSLASGVGLYLLVADGEAAPEIYAAAGSKEQGRAVFGTAGTMVRKSPELEDYLRVQRNSILCPSNDGVFQVVASDGDLQHSYNVHGSMIDEVWAHKNDRLITALESAGGAREQPMHWKITTAGYERDSVLGSLYDDMVRHPLLEQRSRCLRVVRDRENGKLIWWYGPPDDMSERELEDPKVWLECNPASWIQQEYLVKQRQKRRLNDFRRFHLNGWTEQEDAWITAAEWDACRGRPRLGKADERFDGVDIGKQNDSSALVEVGWVGNKLHVRQRIWTPTAKRKNAIRDTRVEILHQAGEEPPITEVAFDPAKFDESSEELEERGLVMVRMDQVDSIMGPASEFLYGLVKDGRLVHDGDEEARRQILAAIAAPTEKGWRLSKRKSRKRIDFAIALAMAVARAMHARSKGRKAEPGVRILG